MIEVDNATWYESPMVPADEFTIEFVEEHIQAGKRLGGTLFRTTTDRDQEPRLCGIVTYKYKEAT